MMPDKYLTDDVLNEIIAGAKTSMEQYLALSLRAERAAVQSCGNQEQLELVSQPYKLPPNSFTDAELEMMSHGDNPQANAYRELLAFRRNSPVIPDGSANMLRRWLAFGRALQSSGSQLPRHLIAETESMLAAPQQEGE